MNSSNIFKQLKEKSILLYSSCGMCCDNVHPWSILRSHLGNFPFQLLLELFHISNGNTCKFIYDRLKLKVTYGYIVLMDQFFDSLIGYWLDGCPSNHIGGSSSSILFLNNIYENKQTCQWKNTVFNGKYMVKLVCLFIDCQSSFSGLYFLHKKQVASPLFGKKNCWWKKANKSQTTNWDV